MSTCPISELIVELKAKTPTLVLTKIFCNVTEEELPFIVVKLLSPGLVELTLTPPPVKFSIKNVSPP